MKNNIVLLTAVLAVSFSTFAQEEQKQKELNEVVVEKESRTYTNKNGNLKVDVANSIYKTVPNAVDLLAKLPKVQLSPDKESISIVGKGSPLLYIDNQKVGINELNSLAVDDIKTIEIIYNPSSKYEAEGRAVILITRKFSKKEGYKVTLSENAQFKKYYNNYSSVNTNFKTGKLEFKANFSYNQIKVWESNGNDFTMPDYGIHSNYLTTAITDRPQFLYGGGVFYKIGAEDYLSVNANRRQQKDIFSILTHTFNQDQATVNIVNTINQNGEHRDFTNAFLNYNHRMKSIGVVLFTGFQYSDFNQEITSEVSNDYNNSGLVLSQLRNQKFDISVFSGRLDLEKKFSNEMKLELGGLYLLGEANTHYEVEQFSPPTTTNSLYHYREENAAAYSTFSGSYKKVNYTVGLRAENTFVKGKYALGGDSSVSKNYISLFPKAEIGTDFNSSNSISIGYAKSISRPDFSSTSQTAIYINPYFIWSNNINLNPSMTNEITLNYQYRDKSLRLVYYNTSNPVYSGASYDATQKILTFTTTNFDKEEDMAIEVTLPFKSGFWNTTNVINLGQTKVEDKLAVVNKSRPSLYCYTNHVFTLPKKIELSFTAWGYTPQKLGVFDRSGLVTMDAAVSKTFFKQWDFALSFNDIFRKMNFKDNFTMNNIASKAVYYTDSRLISLSVKYTFGTIRNSEFKEKNIDDNSGRIK